MSSDLETSRTSEAPTSNDQDVVIPEDPGMEHAESLFRDLFQRGRKGALLPRQLARQILFLIQRRVAAESAAENQSTSMDGDTPGLESMGWMLWGTVDALAREDQTYHDVLIDFINVFLPLLQTKPWSLWRCSMKESTLLLGPQFRESLQGAGKRAYLPPSVPGATVEERMIHSWCNYCRFVARMTRDTEQDFLLYMIWFARDALEDCSWCRCDYVDAAVLAFEGVIDVCGALMFQSDEDFGKSGAGGDGKRRWEGKSGFCKERWLFWEAGLLHIVQDEANRPAPVRDAGRRTASKMQSIRASAEHTREQC